MLLFTLIQKLHCESYFLVTNTEKAPATTEVDEDDEVPDLVENFDEASKDD